MTDITRLGFLKGTSMAAGALAFTSLTPMIASAANKRGKGVLTAGRMGPMLCEVKDGKLVSTTNALAQTVPNSLQTRCPESVFAGSYGWRSSGVLHKAQTLLQRYMSLAGGYSGHLGDYSTGAAQVIMPHVMGSIEVYEQQTTHPVVLESSDVVVLWGMNPMNTLKVAWSSTDCSGLEFFHKLKKSGKTIIAIDPMRHG